MQKYQAVIRINFEAESDEAAEVVGKKLATFTRHPVEVLKHEGDDNDKQKD